MSKTLLPLWRDGAVKAAITGFVRRVTDRASPDFVPDDERIAVFDNDGTLWCEKPVPIQMQFLLGRLAEQAAKDAPLRDRQPWKAVWDKDHAWLSDVITKHYNGDDADLKVLGAALMQSYEGVAVDDYGAQASAFLRDGSNPVLKRPWLGTAYAPMVELLRYLGAYGFVTYIASGGDRDFMRPITEELYGIPPERVIGTSVALEYRVHEGKGDIYQIGRMDVFDDGAAKPVRIWSRIGRRPILAGGNANGDLPMLEFAASGARPSLCLVVDHDDGEREIAYQAGAESIVKAARERRWQVVSVQRDWDTVFV